MRFANIFSASVAMFTLANGHPHEIGATKPVEATPSFARGAAAVKSFNLSSPFHYFPIAATMYERHGPYTIAVDSVNKYLFWWVPTFKPEANAWSHDCLVRMNLDGTGSKSYMYTKGFGPGNISFAVQPVGKESRIWIDSDPNQAGQATKIASFMWEEERTLNATDSSGDVAKFSPIKGASDYSVTYNPTTGNIFLRYLLKGSYRLVSYEPKTAIKGDFSKPVRSFQIPKLKTKSKTIRGYAVSDHNLYIMTGDDVGSVKEFPQTRTEITNINMNSKKVSQGPATATMVSGTPDVPVAQGLAVSLQAGENPKLLMGVVSGVDSYRGAKVYYNNMLNA